MDREQCHFPWRWLQVAGMDLQGQKKLLVSSFHPTDGLGPADTDDGGGQCWRELHSTGRRGAVWINGGSHCPKEAAGPSHLLGAERGCGGGLDMRHTKRAWPCSNNS